MNEVKVSTKDLMSVITNNRTNHLNKLNVAVAKWREDVACVLRKNLDIVERNSSEKMDRTPDRPESHIGDYDRALKMLAMSVDQSVTLTSEQFQCFVEDEWNWKRSWRLSNSKYIED
jgi:hypothetical protein